MVRNHPDRHKPLAERQLRVRKNRAYFDRKPVPAIATLERLAVRKMIDFIAAAMRAKLTIAPADRSQMINAGLFIREGIH
jgi:hypothetical protein